MYQTSPRCSNIIQSNCYTKNKNITKKLHNINQYRLILQSLTNGTHLVLKIWETE